MRKLLIIVALWAGFAGSVWARSIEEQLFASLQAQGYVIVEQGYTFLGRLRVLVQLGDMRREIVINPGTGEILRDYAFAVPNIASVQQAPGSGTDNTAAVATSVASSGSGADPTGSATTSTVDGGDGISTLSGAVAPTLESNKDPLTDMVIQSPILPLILEQP